MKQFVIIGIYFSGICDSMTDVKVFNIVDNVDKAVKCAKSIVKKEKRKLQEMQDDENAVEVIRDETLGKWHLYEDEEIAEIIAIKSV